MPQFSLIEAKAHHCGMLARRLRGDHRDAMVALGYADAHRHLRAAFVASPTFRKSWFIDGRIGGMGGIIGSAMSTTGFVWCAVTNEAIRYPIAIVKVCQANLAEALITKRTLVASTLWGDDTAVRFAQSLGFTLTEESPEKGVRIWAIGQIALAREAA